LFCVRDRVFCASLADVFEDWGQEIRTSSGMVLHQCTEGHLLGLESVFANGCDCIHGCDRIARPTTLDDVRARLFRLIDQTPNLDWLLLTKRPENVRRMVRDAWTEKVDGHVSQNDGDGRRWRRRDNIWLGTSIACQEDADRSIPELLKCRDLCAKTFLSIEPLVGPVELSDVTRRADGVSQLGKKSMAGIDWVIVGGESGPDARPCDVDWIRSIVRQCRDAGVPCFVKQLGAYCLDNDAQSRRAWPLAVPMTLRDNWTRMIYRDPKGGDPAEWPEDLRVREVPT
jgi:protein gp37